MLKFKEEGHIYTWNDREVPSVTTILQDCGIINTKYFKPEHALRGKYVHMATEYYDMGCLDFNASDDLIKLYMESYIEFVSDMGMDYDVGHIELMGYNEYHEYAFTIDRVCKVYGKKSILDIKTGVPSKWVELQLSAYLNGTQYCPEVDIVPEKLYSLQIGKEIIDKRNKKRYKLREHKYNFSTFKAALDVYKYKQPKNRRSK